MVEFIVTRASKPTDIDHRKIETLANLMAFVQTEKWPVLINPMGDSWQLKVFDDPTLLASAQAAYRVLFPTWIQQLKELEEE